MDKFCAKITPGRSTPWKLCNKLLYGVTPVAGMALAPSLSLFPRATAFIGLQNSAKLSVSLLLSMKILNGWPREQHHLGPYLEGAQ